MCRSRRELSNECLLAKISVDTAETELLQVLFKIIQYHSIVSLGGAFNGVTYPDPGIPMLLVDDVLGMKLSDAARVGAHAQILVDSSRETMMTVPPELEEFMSTAVAGEPVHMTVLIERKAETKANGRRVNR